MTCSILQGERHYDTWYCAVGHGRYARAFLTSQAQDPQGWRAHTEQARSWALSAVGTHLIDLWRWYFGEPASVGGGVASPVHQSPNDEIAALVFDYPGRLLAELAVSAVFRGENRLELYGDNGAIIGEGLFGSRPAGTFTCKGQAVTYQPVNPFIEEVADFVQAVQPTAARAACDAGGRPAQRLHHGNCPCRSPPAPAIAQAAY